MNELFTFNTDGNEPTVSARDLHKALGIRKRFSEWFEKNSQGFIENEDFTSVLSGTVVNNGAKRELQDYQLSTDMAKHICLMSRTDKGRECRQRLIDLEKAWNTPEQVMARALKMAGKTIDSLKDRCKFLGGQVVEQKKLIEEMTPKANYVDHILESKSLVATTQIAKDYGMSAMRFNQILNSLKIQYKVNKQWVLYSKYQNCGYVHSKTIDITRSNGNPDVTMQTQWTQKGRLFLYEELKKNNIYPVIEQEAA
nr:MAG TPA: antirepressor protein [Caudoviricetes sp.]